MNFDTLYIRKLAAKILANARINMNEGGAFPKDKYKVYIQRINPRLKTPPYVHVESSDELFHVLVTVNGRIMQVKDYGNRKYNDRFLDVSEKMKAFLEEPSYIGEHLTEIGAPNRLIIELLWKMTEIK